MHKLTCQIVSCAVVFLPFMFGGAFADAQTLRGWVGPVGGDWYAAGNWSPNGSPASGDKLFIGTGAEPTASSLVILDNAGWYDMYGGSKTTIDSFLLGYLGLGQITLKEASTLSTRSASIGAHELGLGIANITGAGTTWSVTGPGIPEFSALHVGEDGYGTLNVSDGAQVITSIGNVSVGSFGSGVGTLNVSGISGNARSKFSVNSGTFYVGESGTGEVNIASWGDLYTRGTVIGKNLGSVGSMTIDDADWHATSVIVSQNGNGTLRVKNNSRVFVTGSMEISSTFGSIQSGSVSVERSTMNIGGDLKIATDIGHGELRISTGGSVSINGPAGTTIGNDGVLVLDGGTLFTRSLNFHFLADASNFEFRRGTLAITQTGAAIDIPIASDSPNTTISLFFAGGTASLGDAASFNGFNHQGTLQISNNSVTLNSAGSAKLGVYTEIQGGTINAQNGVALSPGSHLKGWGNVNARVTGVLGSVIEAVGGELLSLGVASSPAGFNFDGELRALSAITLNSSASVGLGNLTVMGSDGSPGTLSANNGYVVDFGEAVVGYGTINSTNTFTKRSIINGAVQGNSAGQKITLTGYIKGVGTFDNVTFAGTYSPGLSPSLVTVGNIALSPTNTLEIELGGTSRGSQYDAILASGNLALDGSLQISLIDGFAPTVNNVFDILDWASLTGTFSTLRLPSLTAGLSWNTSQLTTAGTLSVVVGPSGDYNQNGVVDAADYAVWRNTLGQTGAGLVADGNGNNQIDAGDYTVWKSHFGQTAGSGSGSTIDAANNTAVPEPASLLLTLTALAAASAIFRMRPWQ